MIFEPDPCLESFCEVLGEMVRVAAIDRRSCRSWHAQRAAVRDYPGRLLHSGCDDRRVGESIDAKFRRVCAARHLHDA